LKSAERNREPARPARHEPSAGEKQEEQHGADITHDVHGPDGNHQAGWEEIKASASVVSTETGPKDTRNIETNSAIRSSERRQKMSTPTTNHTS
jgi:hypothetical protein